MHSRRSSFVREKVSYVGNTLGRMQGRTEGRSWAEKATLNYAGRNWEDQKGKFELGIKGYKERNPAKKKEKNKAVEP